MDPIAYQQLGVALGLGLLVGFQREWGEPHVAGIRTFAMVTVFGAVCAQLSQPVGGWVVAAGMLAVAAMVIVGGFVKVRAGRIDPGLTTEIAALVMYAVGAAVVLTHIPAAVMVGGGVAVLLHWKKQLLGVVRRLGEREVRGIITLVLIALVILPVLPNRTYGPYDVLNPQHIWLMVVLIVGISLGSYIAYRFLGAKAGALLGGILGGLISSTATTVSYARRSRKAPQGATMATLVIAIASTIALVRVGVEIAVVAPSVLPKIAPPFAVLLGVMAASCAVLGFLGRGKSPELTVSEDPAELKAAIVFGLLYAGILFGVAAAKAHFGDRGLYVVAGLSGLTDMDAITLSTAQLVKAGRLELDTGWRMVLLAGLSNLVFKGAAVALLGHRELRNRVAVVFGVAVATGALLLGLWPPIS